MTPPHKRDLPLVASPIWMLTEVHNIMIRKYVNYNELQKAIHKSIYVIRCEEQIPTKLLHIHLKTHF